ncbi:hypothetical protein AB3S75_033528 [Citrus x aurantiifolia]
MLRIDIGSLSYEKASNSRGFSKSFGEIFYTSNYGILQLTNGLTSTPQMGRMNFVKLQRHVRLK